MNILNLNKEYIAIVDRLKAYLEEIQTEIALKERHGENRKAVIEKHQPILFKKLDKYMEAIECITYSFNVI